MTRGNEVYYFTRPASGYKTFSLPLSDGHNKDYAATLGKLDNYFIPKANVPFENTCSGKSAKVGRKLGLICLSNETRTTSCDFGEREDEFCSIAWEMP